MNFDKINSNKIKEATNSSFFKNLFQLSTYKRDFI